ncbi:MAG TPA: FAD-dependent oxidoreductase [Thermomicrobiales bacterium]|nr:FAD-dependent oxidoreductase [Thermomicrobiales bacterium]
MTRKPVVVVGAGPAGIAAALAAAASTHCILLDEQSEPGGYALWRTKSAEQTPDVEVIPRLREAGIDYRPSTSVWALFDGPTVAAYASDHAYTIAAAAVVIATGTVDCVWPVPGWHLNGVFTPRPTLADLRRGAIAPGTRFGIVGNSPQVRSLVEMIKAFGGEISKVTADLTTTRIAGETRVERLGDGRGSATVDHVVLALGRRPDHALALQARAASAFDRQALVEMPLLTGDGATSIPGVFVAGEAAAVRGGDAIRAHGKLGGNSAARVADGTAAPTIPESAPPTKPDVATWPIPSDPETIICREQLVDLATLQQAIRDGAHDVNDLRRRTRAGMGSGQDILPALAALLLHQDPAIPDERLIARVRPPIRPLPFRAVLETLGGRTA